MDTIIKIKCHDCGGFIERKERYVKILESRGMNPVCKKCAKNRQKIYSKKYGKEKRQKGQEIVTLKCRRCGGDTGVKKYKVKLHLNRGGPVCQKCCSKFSSENLRKIRTLESFEERCEIAKRASLNRDNSEIVKKQWKTIKSNKELLNKVCKDRSKRMEKVWVEYSDEKKNHIISHLVASIGKSRSGLSNALKESMEKNGILGFESEQIFHGFIPDEINHKLKIIVELFGEIYHCDPRKYKDENFYVNVIKKTVGEQWRRDRIRLACFYKHGYEVIIVWEKDFRRNPEREIGRIKDEVNKKRISIER